MNVLILAAGYATRLYPLTLRKAKPLLEVGGKPMISWLMESLRGIKGIETIYVVTNAKFAADFAAWAKEFEVANPAFHLKVVNDGTTSDNDKLGAIGDINFVLTREELTGTDLLVVAGDNLFSDSLKEFVAEARKSAAAVALYDVGDIEQVRKYGQVQVNADGVITQFEEKPPKPTSSLIAIAVYFYSAEVLPLFTTYIAAGNNPDQPGRFIQWVHTRKPVKAIKISGRWFDVGSKETLAEASEVFAAEAGPAQGKRPSSNSIKSK
jgi:Nucleoside-diphosphate-sugar pyrophosphorylase involved in lipopolysaccharide biosynthesis/translation initiation factor 2B, gamma/epsilon subunits (eIF-2Bgamma/eIF-2Bepsilon)